MIYLSYRDITELVDLDEMMDQIEAAYRIYDEGSYSMPDRWHLNQDGLTALYMPCFLSEVYGTKILSVVPRNVDVGMPMIDGLMLLNDRTTGKILTMMDGKAITALRTGAVGGVAIRHLTGSTVKTLGVIGAGVQGYYQTIFAAKARPFTRVLVFDIAKQRAHDLRDRLKAPLGTGVEIVTANGVGELVAESEVIITATTANAPVLPDDPAALSGKHYIGIGSYKPTMREYPDCFFGLIRKVYIDQEFAKGESGDLCVPMEQGLLKEDDIEYFSTYLLHETAKPAVVEGTTFFKSVGMALFDVVAAQYINRKAVESGTGNWIGE